MRGLGFDFFNLIKYIKYFLNFKLKIKKWKKKEITKKNPKKQL